MTENAFHPAELQELLAAWCDDCISSEDFARLESLLGTSAPARQMLIEYMDQHAELHWKCGDLKQLEALRVSDALPAPRLREELPRGLAPLVARRSAIRFAMVAAPAMLLVLLAVLISWQKFGDSDSPIAMQRRLEHRHDSPILVDVRQADWGSPDTPKVGEPLENRTFLLRSGSIELRSAGGSRMQIDGPAEFRPESPRELALYAGAAHVRVTPADVGYVIRTRYGKVIDLGTEFAVRIAASGEADVFVLDGRVELDTSSPLATSQVRVTATAQQAKRISAAGIVSIIFDESFARRMPSTQLAAEINIPQTQLPTPANAPLISDQQKIGIWNDVNFIWQPADPASSRPVNFEITLPAGHRYFTVAIDDAYGQRVRNLLDMADAKTFGGDPTSGQPQKLAIQWNGLDDRGRSLPDGSYHVRGLSHPGFKLTYSHTFYNPGTPPWEHYKNSGWGGDHGFPGAVACVRGMPNSAWKVVLGGPIAEGGSPAFVLDDNDRKIYAFGRGWAGPMAMAFDNGLIWVSLWGGKDLQRIEVGSGKGVPFQTPGGPKQVVTFEDDLKGIAVGKTRVAVYVPKAEEIHLLDKQSGQTLRKFKPAHKVTTHGLAYDTEDRLYIATDAGLLRVQGDGEPELLNWSGMKACGPISTDNQGNLAVFDRGVDQQIKVFSLDGKLVRSLGKQGGQQGLRYDQAALRDVDSFSFNDAGEVWVSEGAAAEPGRRIGCVRRIAVFAADGSFKKHFVGNTQYGANHTCLHEQDPTMAYAYGVIYRIDPSKTKSYEPERYVASAPRPDAPLTGWPGGKAALFASARMFRSNASGQMREYIVYHGGFPILYVEKNGDYRPAAAFGMHESHPVFPKLGDDDKALFLWSDANDDEQVQPEEMQHVPTTCHSWGFFAGWGYPLANDLTWYIEGRDVKPVRFTATGVPVYDVAHTRRLQTPGHFIRVGKHLVYTQHGGWATPEAGYYFAGNYVFTDLDGKREATYRYNWPGVHGSWKSTLPAPGQTGATVGELFYAGIADAGPELGHVFAAQGNQGQSFVFSEDGLFVTSLFKDTRNNPKGYGKTEERGADWTEITLMGEAFGGWFGRQNDGVYRYMFGRNACHVVEVHGFDQVKRFAGGSILLSGEAGTKPSPDSAKTDAVEPLLVSRIDGRGNTFKVDGNVTDWADIPRREIKVGDIHIAKVAAVHDLQKLYLLWEVQDQSPLRNQGRETLLLFKTGDAVDLMLGPIVPSRSTAVAGDLRWLLVPTEGRFSSLLYRPIVPGTADGQKTRFSSPVREISFDSVAELPEGEFTFAATTSGYICEARVPFDKIGVQYSSGLHLRGDLGVLSSNDGGLVTERRAYLFNRETNVVSDVPSEAELQPQGWGILVLE